MGTASTIGIWEKARATQISLSRRKAFLGLLIVFMLGDFVYHGVVPALSTPHNDFSDQFVGSWLLRHGQNPYDQKLAVEAASRLFSTHVPIVPIYIPAGYLIAAPMSYFPWKIANFIWALTGFASVGIMAWSLIRLGRFSVRDDEAWFITGMVFAFRPLHTALQVGNATLITSALCFLGVLLADRKSELTGGILFGLATCLKPQVGIWFLLYYLLRQRWRVFGSGTMTGLSLTVLAVACLPVSAPQLLADYRTNLHYWFGPGGQNDFTAANPFRFPVVDLQVVLYPFTHDSLISNVIAYSIFGLGAVLWGYVVFREHGLRSDTLALTCVLALSFLAVYHRVNDAGVLLIGLCWLLEKSTKAIAKTKVAVMLLFLVLATGQSVLIRLQPHIPLVAIHSALWQQILVPYFVWSLLLLAALLLYAVVISSHVPASSARQSFIGEAIIAPLGT